MLSEHEDGLTLAAREQRRGQPRLSVRVTQPSGVEAQVELVVRERWHGGRVSADDLAAHAVLEDVLDDGLAAIDERVDRRRERVGRDRNAFGARVALHALERHCVLQAVHHRIDGEVHAELAKRLIELKKHGASGGPHDRERCMLIARTEIERRRAEAAFFAVMAAEEQVVALFMPLDPDGRLWDDDAIWRCLTAAIRVMDKLEGAAGERLREKIRKHVARREAQCAGHTLLWRTVPIGMRSDATWSRERVLSALLERVRLRGQCRDDTRTRYEQYLSEQAVRALNEALSRQAEDVKQAYRAVRLLLKRPARSSSLVESFNARLRVLQQSRRNVSDALLGLLAFRWNTSRREEGPRRLQSPWQTLGLIEKEDTRTWVELLLDSLPDD